MNALLVYLLQVVISSGILYGYYCVALRNRRFHQYNRFYLLFSVFISIGIPFLNIPVYFNQPDNNTPLIWQTLQSISAARDSLALPPVVHSQNPSTGLNASTWIYAGYLVVMTGCFVRLALSLLKLRRIAAKGTTEQLGVIRLINTGEPSAPFSFLRWLFWNRRMDLHSPEGEQVFRHELFHIRQRHTLDILFLEFITALCWINPFFHLVKREVKVIHEFLADRFATSEQAKWEYAELLLTQAFRTHQRLVNPFFHNQIKRRITMITHPHKTTFSYLRKLLVLPIALLVTALFAFTYRSRVLSFASPVKDHAQTLKTTPNLVPVETTDTAPVKTKHASNTNVSPVDERDLVFEKAEVDAQFSGNWPQYVEQHLDAAIPMRNHAPDGSYSVYLQFIVNADGSVRDFKALTNHGFGMEEEAMRLVKSAPRWIPAQQNSQAVSSYKRQRIDFIVGQQPKIKVLPEIVAVGYLSPKGIYPGEAVECPVLGTTEPGSGDWRKFFERNLDANIPMREGWKAGSYTVFIEFTVSNNGEVSDVRMVNLQSSKTARHCLEVMKHIPRVMPNGEGRPYFQPITFQLIEDKPISVN